MNVYLLGKLSLLPLFRSTSLFDFVPQSDGRSLALGLA